MTPRDPKHDVEAARDAADEALRVAKQRKAFGLRLKEGWRRSREDNNFRAMLRQLAEGGER